MKLLVTALLLGFSFGANALTLKDFRFTAPGPAEDHLSGFAQCDKRLGGTPTEAQAFEVDAAIAAASEYFDRWRVAKSGVEFAKATLDEALAIDARMIDILEKLALPPAKLEILDTAHLQVVWVHMYLGYAATRAELKALQKELEIEIGQYLGDDPPDDLRERWLHDIMLLSHQTVLANQRGAGADYPLELMHVAQQLRGISPVSAPGEDAEFAADLEPGDEGVGADRRGVEGFDEPQVLGPGKRPTLH